jgi:hypothetical protein
MPANRPPEPPAGFKNYPMIMTPDGQLHEPASCWLYEVNVFSEEDVKREVSDSSTTLSETARRFGAQDLAPILRKGLQD